MLDLEAQRQRDDGADPRVLRQRDGRIGQTLTGVHAPRDRLIGWIRHLREHDPSLPGHAAARGLRIGTWILCLIAMLFGAGAAAGVLSYSGQQPVNVLAFIGVLIIPQVVLMLLWAVTMLPVDYVKTMPLVKDLHETLRAISPGRAVGWLLRRVSGERNEQVRAVAGRLLAEKSRHGEVMYLTLAGAAQLAGVCFNIGAVTAFLALVVFSDLAFGWSTTLRLDPVVFHAWTTSAAGPWSWAWPDAVPSIELVEQSRYYRLEGQGLADRVDPSALGGWWPFLLACLLMYGLLPRMLAGLAVAARRRGVLDRLTFDHPDHALTIQRLGPVVQTTATEPGQDHAMTADGDALEGDALPPAGGRCRVLCWRASPMDEAATSAWVYQRLGYEPTTTHTARGQSGEADREAILQAADASLPVVVLAKAWESPSRDVTGMLTLLRQQLGTTPAIIVGLVDQDAQGRPVAPDDADARIWRRKLQQLGDGQLFIVDYQPPDTSEADHE